MAGRYSNARAILGDELFERVQTSRVLVVGAGGIGCELIKNMVMTGFGGGEKGQIEVLDLDTIDLSNLNRQFLFQKQHVKRPKAVVARETALKFNPNVNIKALHRNIKDNDFNVSYFKTFDFVLNALDNLDARRHVNKMCLAANIPLIESGTSGYAGQVQPIKKDLTECYDCIGKPVPKTFAVCTIRSTPSTAHHCIAWAKSYLLPQLFGADDEADNGELDDAEKNGENADEIANLRKEAEAIKELRLSLKAPDAAQRVFDKVYNADILRLLKMEDMWKHRKPPHPLEWAALGAIAKENEVHADGSGIKDQRALTLGDSFALFASSVDRLAKRFDEEHPIAFDKDDDDTLDFVVASANLRASAFDIESQTRFQVKEYAGNIIPAIATTNAIIAGVLVLQALHILRDSWASAKMVFLTRSDKAIFSRNTLSLPQRGCAVCRVVYAPLEIREGATLGEFVEAIVGGEGEGGLGWGEKVVSIREGSRVLWETEDFEDNKEKTLESLSVGEGKFLIVQDEDDPSWPVSFAIGSALPTDSSKAFHLPVPLPPTIPLREPEPKEDSDHDDEALSFSAAGANGSAEKGRKRSAESAELEIGGEGGKKTKVDGQVLELGGEEDDDLIIVE